MNATMAAPGASASTITVKDLLFCGLWVLCVASGMAQLFIDGSPDNVESVGWVLCSCTVVLSYLWRSQATTTHPLSSLSLLGLLNSTQMAALIAQTADGQSLSAMLRVPTFTFFMLAVVSTVATGLHLAYRYLLPLQVPSQWLANRVWGPLGALSPPPPIVIWCLSAIGILAQLVGGGGIGDVGGKFLAGLAFMMWLPFLIPIYQRMSGGTYCNIKKQLPFVVGLGLFIVAESLARNGRGGIFAIPMQMTLVFLLYFLHTPHPVTRRFMKGLAVLGLTAAVGMAVMTDLATAMVVARDKRDTVSTSELMQYTWEVYLDKPLLEARRESSNLASLTSQYDENYLSNPLLARFAETKFHDNMFFMVSDLRPDERWEAAALSVFRVVLLFPQTVHDFFETKVDKDQHLYSMGDYYINLHHGAGFAYVTGSIWADAYALAGLWFPFACALLLLPCFWIFDGMSQSGKAFVVSPVAMCMAWQIFHFGLGGESIGTKMGFLLRDTPQKLMLYLLTLAVLTFVLRLFKLMPPKLSQKTGKLV